MFFKSFGDLGSEAARNLQLSIDPVSFLIIDEFSVIGYRLMAAREQKCQEIKPVSNEPFGGLFIYLIPYIMAATACLYKRSSIKDILTLRGKTVLRTFEKNVTLTKSMRQNDGRQQQFRKILDSLSRGQVTCPSIFIPYATMKNYTASELS